MIGQILPDSAFGTLLARYSASAKTIVEVGTGGGEGSTRCLMAGCVEEDGQSLVSVEIDPELHRQAEAYWSEVPNITVICGRVGETFDAYAHPGGEEMRTTLGYDFSREQFLKAANVLHLLPAKVDLLLIDAGEFSATGELDALIDRCAVIALDDTSSARAHKNVANRLRLIDQGWVALHDNLSDRNGYAIFKRPC